MDTDTCTRKKTKSYKRDNKSDKTYANRLRFQYFSLYPYRDSSTFLFLPPPVGTLWENFELRKIKVGTIGFIKKTCKFLIILF